MISVACVGDAVACWLLEKQATEDQHHKKSKPSKRSRNSAYLNSSSELARETEGSRWNSLGSVELRGSTISGFSRAVCSLALEEEDPVSSISGLDTCLAGELAEAESPLLC